MPLSASEALQKDALFAVMGHRAVSPVRRPRHRVPLARRRPFCQIQPAACIDGVGHSDTRMRVGKARCAGEVPAE
jgi:hypothetical protein